jgi:choline-sulfatase
MGSRLPRHDSKASAPNGTAFPAPRRVAVAVFAAALLGVAGLVAFRHPRVQGPARPLHILLVTIDTLRADHLGCYGFPRAATPTLDGLAARGVRFATAVVHVPLTAPSHASILTGRTPPHHGLRDNGGFVLPPSARSIAEYFRESGYRTAAFISGFPLDRRFGFDRGFETYDDHLPKGNDPRRTPYVERTADRTTDAVLRWLEASGGPGGAWFVWVHYYDPHAPYEPPGDFASRFAATPYDGEIAFVDAELGRLLRALDTRDPTGGTLVLVTADHGESLGEHGEETHGLFVYDATLRVPWIMAGPGVPKGRVATTVARGIDVSPTLLDYAGLSPHGDMDGRSLRPAAEGRAMEDAPTYAESLYSALELGWAPLHAWRTGHFKLIDAPRPELYDLEADAGERENRVAEQRARSEEMGRKLHAAIGETPPRETRRAVDPETAERLGALGYVALPQAGGALASLRDPKDGVLLLARFHRGMSLARTEPVQAIRELSAVLAEDPGLLVARRIRAVAYASAGRHEAAIADLRALQKEGALTADDAVVLGDNLRFAGRTKDAIETLERTARENPKFPQPLLSLAETFVRDGRTPDAVKTYERVLALVPDHIEALRGLGDLALMRGALDDAQSRYARILEVEPEDAPAMTKLGVVRMREGRGEEAVSLFLKAIDREPKNGEALLYLAGALASSGRSGEAVPYFERALAAGPRSTMALNGLGLTRLELGDRRGAAALFKESLTLDPRQPDIRKALADLLPGISLN